MENEFERYPHLASRMEYLANCAIPGWSMLDWDDFCSAINNALVDAKKLRVVKHERPPVVFDPN